MGLEGPYPPYDGQLRLDVFTHVSAGANMVEYWHWHSIHYGQETYWKGVLGHDLEPGRPYNEVSRTAHELLRIGSQIADYKRVNPVAILYSDDSHYGIEFMKFSDHQNYNTILRQMYHALYQDNVGDGFCVSRGHKLFGLQSHSRSAACMWLATHCSTN